MLKLSNFSFDMDLLFFIPQHCVQQMKHMEAVPPIIQMQATLSESHSAVFIDL